MRERTKEGRSEGENGRILAHLYISHMHIDTERARERKRDNCGRIKTR